MRATWPPTHQDETYTHTATTPEGVKLRCYDGIWCAMTIAGTWRSAVWLGAATPNGLGFVTPVPHQTPILPGQLGLNI